MESCLGKAPDTSGTPVRRLRADAYVNAVAALTGETPRRDSLPLDEHLGPFLSNLNSALDVASVEAYAGLAEQVASKVDAAKLADCEEGATEADCADAFARRFAGRAYRRPLGAEEVERFSTLFAAGREGASFADGIRLMIEATLQSPHFLYQVEVGKPVQASPGISRLNSYEVASRLSLALTDALPDDELRAAAADGRLDTLEGVRAQAQRLLSGQGGAEVLSRFHRQWLGVAELETAVKNAQRFPEFDSKLVDAMLEEVDALSTHVAFDMGGSVTNLLDRPESFVGETLAPLHDLSGAPGVAPNSKALDVQRRLGVLTSPAVMASHAHSSQTSPVLRGYFVREHILCDEVPLPPGDVDDTPPDPVEGTTTRDLFLQHTTDPSCKACHQLLDPVGWAFENYDALGRFRTTDQGSPVDSSARIEGDTDVNGTYANGVEMSRALARSAQVAGCYERHWFRFLLGRKEGTRDACSMTTTLTVAARGEQSKDQGAPVSIEQQVMAIVASPAFLHIRQTDRNPEGEE